MRREAQRPLPVLLAEREADGAAELDELGFAKLDVEGVPQLVGRDVGVPDDRLRPAERELLPRREPVEVRRLVVPGDEAEAQPLQLRVEQPAAEDTVAHELPRGERCGHACTAPTLP